MRIVLVGVVAVFLGACAREAPAPAGAPTEAAREAPGPEEAPGQAPGESSEGGALARSRQHLLVITEAPNEVEGTLHRMERVGGAEGGRGRPGSGSGNASWRQVGPSLPVVVGRSGIGPKREGDGRSPQGVFELGPVFGYAPEPPPGVTLPYQPMSAGSVCVDDPASVHYNEVFDADTLTGDTDWTTYEDMRRDLADGDDLYKWGLVVHYNLPPEPGAGSCIFLHVWRAAGSPTSGCTAMTEDRLLAVLRWLDPQAQPVLVQGTRAYLDSLRLDGGLPYPVPR